jgi:hypothetical protein
LKVGKNKEDDEVLEWTRLTGRNGREYILGIVEYRGWILDRHGRDGRTRLNEEEEQDCWQGMDDVRG